MKRIALLALLSACLAAPLPAAAAGPDAVVFQGNLVNGLDEALPDGVYPMAIGLYDMPSGGTLRFLTTPPAVPVVDGFFTVTLQGAPNEISNVFRAFDHLWLEVQVDTDAPPNGIQPEEIFSPRFQITMSPYAVAATEADLAAAATTAVTANTATTAGTAATATTAATAANALALEGAARAQFLEIDEDTISVLGDNGNPNATMTFVTGQPNNGAIAVQNSAGDERASMLVSSDGSGTIATRGVAGNVAVGLFGSNNSGFANFGAVEVNDSNGDPSAITEVLSNGAGSISLFGPNGEFNVLLSHTTGFVNNGAVAVMDGNGDIEASLVVSGAGTGNFFASGTKSFVEELPGDPSKKIVYISLEGDEAGIYHRGTAALANGRGKIALPDHFALIAAPGSVTVQLTPASFDSKGVAVGAIAAREIEIGELAGGTGSYDVHFTVFAKRARFADHQPVQDAETVKRMMGAAAPEKRTARQRAVPTAAK